MKGNMFLGYARGSVGDVTFARQKGQQVARARNRKPNNPRSSAQMRQRSRFISAVKFFSRGNQNFFTFAFEDKRPAESDYNAFMRYNSANGIWMTKADFDLERYPALGQYIMTRGTLTGIMSVVNSSTNFIATLNAIAPSGTITTVGALSSALIASNAFNSGDIITLVDITTDAEVGTSVQPIIAGDGNPQWQLKQFALDEADTTLLSTFGITATSVNSRITLTHAQLTANISAFAIVQSRKTAEGLKVSNSNLVNNAAAAQAYSYGTSMSWVNIVLADWQARDEAVLEGGNLPS